MSLKRIACIHKYPTHQDPYHHIEYVGAINGSTTTERLTVSEVIRQLESPTGDRFYVRGNDGSTANVRVGKCLHCSQAHKYIRTTPDYSTQDNLLSQPECIR
jgi:hypothetical protein